MVSVVLRAYIALSSPYPFLVLVYPGSGLSTCVRPSGRAGSVRVYDKTAFLHLHRLVGNMLHSERHLGRDTLEQPTVGSRGGEAAAERRQGSM